MVLILFSIDMEESKIETNEEKTVVGFLVDLTESDRSENVTMNESTSDKVNSTDNVSLNASEEADDSVVLIYDSSIDMQTVG